MTGATEIYRSIDELRAAVGRELGPTPWFAVDQPRVDRFADSTQDHQWIHVDPDRAASGSFGTTVAHGFLTLSLIPQFLAGLRRIEGTTMGINYGLNRVRFPAPVRVGSRVRARTTMIELDAIGERAVQAVNRVVIEVEGEEKPACVADLVGRYYFRRTASSSGSPSVASSQSSTAATRPGGPAPTMTLPSR